MRLPAIVLCACFGLAIAGCRSGPALPVGGTALEATAVLSPAAEARLREAMASSAYPQTTSVLVIKDGRTVFEAYSGAGAPEKLNDTRSATKTIAALAVGLALEDGYLASVDAPVWALLQARAPANAGDTLTRAITVRDLLTMTSAFHCDDNNDTPGQEEQMYPKRSWTAFTMALPSEPGWSRASDGLGPWRYCTAGTFLLGQVLEEVTGQRIDAYVRARLFEPLGIARAQWDMSPSGELQTGGGLELTSEDLAKLAWMLTDRGRWKGRQIVPAAWVKEMTTIRRPAFEGMSYGYLMWQRPYKTSCGTVEAWFMAGNGGNHIIALPSIGAAVVVTREAYNTRNMHPQSFDLVETFVLPSLTCAAG